VTASAEKFISSTLIERKKNTIVTSLVLSDGLAVDILLIYGNLVLQFLILTAIDCSGFNTGFVN